MRYFIGVFIVIVAIVEAGAQQLLVKKTSDFPVSGKGDAIEWKKADWLPLTHRSGKKTYETKVKMMYSDSGVYCLFHNVDDKITSTMNEDFLNLWTEDVVEVFFWTDEKYPIYFEYEISPRNFELPILVPNLDGKFLGWRPWNYTGPRKIKHATNIEDNSWTAEVFIPYKTLQPLTKVPPVKGSTWRCNMYRVDYDDGDSEWSWQLTRTNFHDFKKFGVIKFE